MSITRILAAASIASIAFTGAALAQTATNPQKSAKDQMMKEEMMKKDAMGKHGGDSMKKDAMGKDSMKKDAMGKKVVSLPHLLALRASSG